MAGEQARFRVAGRLGGGWLTPRVFVVLALGFFGGATAANATASRSAVTATPGYCHAASTVLSAFATGAASGNTKEVVAALKSVSTTLPSTESTMLAATHGLVHTDVVVVFGFFNEYINLLKSAHWDYENPTFSKSSEYRKLESEGVKMTSAGEVVGSWLQTHC